MSSSRKMPTRPVKLEVHIESRLLEEAVTKAAERSWLVTLRTCLDGTEAPLGQMADGCGIVGARPEQQLRVTFLGQPDDYCALYQVTEAVADPLGGDPRPVSVRLTPRFHPIATTVYKLDERLAALVGREYLAHPKYALSVLLAYAHSKRLVTSRSIMCDRLLTDLLGCPGVRSQALWNKLAGLMTRVTVEDIKLEHDLAGSSGQSVVVKELSVDAKQNLYPVRWINNGREATLLERSHTDGDLPLSMKAAATAAKKSKKRLLQRHKSI